MNANNSTVWTPPEATDPALAEAVRRLAQVYTPECIYLFGSVARGDAGPDSDYDILIVVPDTASFEQRRSIIGYQALAGLGIAKDLLVWTRAEFDKRLHLKSSLPATVVREGKVMYAA